MRAVIQRVSSASVSINQNTVGHIASGFLVLVGIEISDSSEDSDWLANKIAKIRIFEDSNGLMNRSLNDINGEVLVISQFTLHAKTKKGNRPSFTRAAQPDHAKLLYQSLIHQLNKSIQIPCQSGEFGTNMQVSLVNDGPVTIIIDSKNRE